MERTPDMNCATDKKTLVRFTAKPVCANRVLNCPWVSILPNQSIDLGVWSK